jgi:peptidyl-prolyl cis-trans isomerase-like 1
MTTLVTLHTSEGDVAFELYEQHAPKASYNFVTLAERGYYNGSTIFRILPDFMVQGGDPTNSGTGGESCYGDLFEDEITSALRFTGAGLLASASAGPNRNGSQFFVTLRPCPALDGKNTIFGRVASGMSTLRRIAGARCNESDAPFTPITVRSATVQRHAALQTRPTVAAVGPAIAAPRRKGGKGSMLSMLDYE